jgi:queuine tRNA-ribosyltransferase subunit QTRTD1
MLKVVLKSPYGRRKAHATRFPIQTRLFSIKMSPHEESQHEFFTVNSSDISTAESNARTGKLALKGRKGIETPNFLAIASRGAVPHATPDVILEHTTIGGVHMALEDCKFEASWHEVSILTTSLLTKHNLICGAVIEKAPAGTPPILNCPPRKSAPLHTFTALPPSIITLLAPRRTPAVSAPTGNTDHSIWLFSSVGFQPLKTSSYIEYVQKLQPDITIGLADISYGTLPGTKRVEKMGDRTSCWLDSMSSAIGQSEENENSTPAIFAPVLSIDFHSQSEYLHHIADDLADSISGLAFYSSSLLPDIPATTAMTRLPRLSLDEPPSPHHILRQISLGMDLFTIPFINFATDSGLALTFKFPKSPSDDSACTEANGSSTIKPLAIDLSSPSHATSTIPLTPACTCYACTTHHRAYIQHLLSAREMLGWVLLQIHNHHMLSAFFADIRESIRAGTFEECKDRFEREYESELPEGTGQRPRARGYHFKSEGKGEPKRNKPAWGALVDGEGDVSGSGGGDAGFGAGGGCEGVGGEGVC